MYSRSIAKRQNAYVSRLNLMHNGAGVPGPDGTSTRELKFASGDICNSAERSLQ